MTLMRSMMRAWLVLGVAELAVGRVERSCPSGLTLQSRFQYGELWLMACEDLAAGLEGAITFVAAEESHLARASGYPLARARCDSSAATNVMAPSSPAARSSHAMSHSSPYWKRLCSVSPEGQLRSTRPTASSATPRTSQARIMDLISVITATPLLEEQFGCSYSSHACALHYCIF